MLIKIMQLHKKSVNSFDEIEDKYSINENNKAIAISDGASQGYQSNLWARILTDKFVDNPVFDPLVFYQKILIPANEEFQKKIKNIPELPNKTYALLDKEKRKKGAFATFLGIKIFGNGECKAIACGDSSLIVFPLIEKGVSSINHFPEYNESVNTFIHSYKIQDKTFDVECLKIKNFKLEPGDDIYMITDAINRFLIQKLKKGYKSYINELLLLDNIKSFDGFLAFAENNWETGALEQDDLTVLAINKLNFNSYIADKYEILPPSNFSYNSSKTNIHKSLNYDMKVDDKLKKIEEEIEILNILKASSQRKLNRIIAMFLFFIFIQFIVFYFYFRDITIVTLNLKANVESLTTRTDRIQSLITQKITTKTGIIQPEITQKTTAKTGIIDNNTKLISSEKKKKTISRKVEQTKDTLNKKEPKEQSIRDTTTTN